MSKETNKLTDGKNSNTAAKEAFDSIVGDKFSLAPLTPKERERAADIAAAAGTLAMKGLLHRLDSKKYPVPANSSSAEAKAAKLAKEIPANVFARLRPLVEKAVREPARMSRIVGKLKKVDFQNPI